jgi:hypothetical protein
MWAVCKKVLRNTQLDNEVEATLIDTCGQTQTQQSANEAALGIRGGRYLNSKIKRIPHKLLRI